MTAQAPVIEIRPQAGPQEAFLATPADIAFMGGAAGGGKSWGLLLEPVRHINNPKFGGVIFRREFTQISQEGGLWEKSEELYNLLGAEPNQGKVRWVFPAGARMRFAHMQHESDKFKYQGGEMAYIGLDELTHFSEGQFFYLVSRNRSMSGVRPYIRATCNPDPDSWVRRFIDWWIGPDGYAIPERSGVLRWFARVGDDLVWADTREQLLEENPTVEPIDALSFTFILSRLKDNPALTEKDPSYRAKLRLLPRVERERLLGDEERGGNWDVRAVAGMYFKREWCEVVEHAPEGLRQARAWDFAATPPSAANPDPDWTTSTKSGRSRAPERYVLHATRMRGTPSQVELHFIETALRDGPEVVQIIPQDPGSAGKVVSHRYSSLSELGPRVTTTYEGTEFTDYSRADVLEQIRAAFPEATDEELAALRFEGIPGITVMSVRPSKDKVQRFKPTSTLAEQGLIKVKRGAWNDWWFRDLEAFPPEPGRGHDDTADSTSDSINHCPAPSAFRVRGESV